MCAFVFFALPTAVGLLFAGLACSSEHAAAPPGSLSTSASSSQHSPPADPLVMPNLVGMYWLEAEPFLRSQGWSGQLIKEADVTGGPSKRNRIVTQNPVAGQALDRHGDITVDRFRGAAGVDPKGTPEEVILAQPFEHNIGVGDRRVNSADVVTRRPRLGACALRADPQQAAAVEPGEAAASGADRMHVDRGGFDR